MKTKAENRWARIAVTVLLLGSGWAARTYGFAGGTGEPNDPYQIATVADLLSVGSDKTLMRRCFALVNDLDLDPNLPGGRVFEDALIGRDSNPSPNSSSGGFWGVFDGRGHTIRHLCIVGKSGHDTGLFGICDGLIQNLHLQDVQVSGTSAGGLAGLCGTGGMILRCSVTGRVTGSYQVGGLAGRASCGLIFGCEAHADVIGDANSGAGGLVGYVSGPAPEVIECRASGAVTGGDGVGGLIGFSISAQVLRCAAVSQVGGRGAAGGLIGRTLPFHSSFIDCYARGSVAGATAGGLIGDTGSGSHIYILNCYAAGTVLGQAEGANPPFAGGLFGCRNWSPFYAVYQIADCFWDRELSQVPVSTGSTLVDFGAGLTTQQMQQRTTFAQAGWDFDSIWAMPEGDYPVLQWERTRAAEN